ncbi:hypothetical protein [Bacteriovorax sp. Seq25_V]|uniref:hypothetical protein n=1 Tax=Bacteriovorax sp. Seq25_V TaxID=1201288 RepID=UPI00038A51A9|nr:hypothetical protein [Bacteriovorax sp. Seq25_V]EQC46821.1 hypothetical protein M900_2533 [Bacteriovorax sp. Seq25_V]
MRIFFLYAILLSFLSISFADYFHNVYHKDNYEITTLGGKSQKQEHREDCDFEKITKAYTGLSKLLSGESVSLDTAPSTLDVLITSQPNLITLAKYSILRVRGPPSQSV